MVSLTGLLLCSFIDAACMSGSIRHRLATRRNVDCDAVPRRGLEHRAA